MKHYLGPLKSRGFNFEESKLIEDYKIEKSMAFLFIAFVWSVLAEDYRELERPILLKKNIIKLKVFLNMVQSG